MRLKLENPSVGDWTAGLSVIRQRLWLQQDSPGAFFGLLGPHDGAETPRGDMGPRGPGSEDSSRGLTQLGAINPWRAGSPPTERYFPRPGTPTDLLELGPAFVSALDILSGLGLARFQSLSISWCSAGSETCSTRAAAPASMSTDAPVRTAGAPQGMVVMVPGTMMAAPTTIQHHQHLHHPRRR